jgi:membrane protein YqaA with SNARE-associated domain
MLSYLALFFSAFVAATLAPMGSEAVLFALVRAGEPVVWLVLVASVGNTLGSVVNYGLGRGLLRHPRVERCLRIKPEQLSRIEHWFARFGPVVLVLAWLPVVGDPLTLVAGAARVRFAVFLFWVALGKTARYAVVVGLAQGSQVLF